MTGIQFIERAGHREFAVLPIDIWKRVAPLLEDLEDEAIFDQAKAEDEGLHIPAAVLDAELAGAHPVAAWRQYRQLNEDALSNQAHISKAHLSQIEHRERVGTTQELTALAQVLQVPVEFLNN